MTQCIVRALDRPGKPGGGAGGKLTALHSGMSEASSDLHKRN